MITGNRIPLQGPAQEITSDRGSAGSPPEKWQQALASMITGLPELLDYLDLRDPPAPLADMAGINFPVRVTRHYADLITPGDWQDPLLAQILPWQAETDSTQGFSEDPLAEEDATVLPGLIHKYASRVLIVPTSACAIHCRYCFRRHFPYAEHRLSPEARNRIMDYLTRHPDINEVIFSGGDPLMLTDRHLAGWLEALEAVPSLSRVRFHTRLPVVLPQRLTTTLRDRLAESRLSAVLVLHANHAREITAALADRLAPLRAQGVTLLNQAVLLRDVNDTVGAQRDLAESLFSAGVLPYYLHQTDHVSGTAHMTLPDQAAISLHHALKRTLPGFLVPRMVREIPGEPAKTWLPYTDLDSAPDRGA